MTPEPDHQPVPNDDPDDSGLDARQERMILALLEHPTHDKAAAALGISTVTLWRATKKPEFAEAYRKARRDAFSQSVARLQHASNAAVGTLLRVTTDREAPAASRVRAGVMKTVTRRIGKLEDTFRPGNGKPLLLLVVTAAEKRLALDKDRCVQILGECGFLPTGVPVGVVNLAAIPHGLDADELGMFLREHGAETCGLNGVQNQDE